MCFKFFSQVCRVKTMWYITLKLYIYDWKHHAGMLFSCTPSGLDYKEKKLT